jgi:pimeloyl-ACP methyl ester carboxylesterase
VILLNAGADYHIGASRIYVELARSWASRGYFVLRMDLAGLGDSGTRPGREPNNVFPPEAVEDIREAIEFLVTRYGIRNLTLAGLCSGAYHALRAAVAALPVHLILLINPPNFFWKEGRNPQNFFWDEWMTVNDLQRAELQRGQYRLQLRSLVAWKKLITGNADVGHIFNIYLHRLFMHTETAVRNLARYLRIPLPRDLGRELEQVGARGVNVVFAFARGEPGLDLLKVQGGNGLKRLGRRCRIHIIDDADHIFSRRSARTAMERIISAELFSKAR